MPFVSLLALLVLCAGFGWAGLVLSGYQPATKWERLFLIGNLGVPIATSVAFLTFSLHPGLFPVAFLALLALAGWRQRSAAPDAPAPQHEGPTFPKTTALLLVGLGLVLGASVIPELVYLADSDGGIYRGYADQLYHVAIVDEILRGTPPAEFPFLAGEPFWAYHIYPDLFEACVAWVSFQGDPLVLHHVVAPVYLWVLITCGVGLLMQRWTGRPLAVGLAMVLFFSGLLPGQERRVAYLLHNTPALYGMSALLGMGILLTGHAQGRREGAAILLGIHAATLFYFKANNFLLVFPAFGVWLLHGLRSERRRTVQGGLATALFLAPLLVHYSSLSVRRSMDLEYGAFMVYAATRLGPGYEKVASVPGVGPAAVFAFLWITILSGYLLLFALPPLVASVRKSGWQPWHSFVLLFGVACAGVGLFVVEATSAYYRSWNVGAHSMHGGSLLAVLGGSYTLARLVEAGWPRLEARKESLKNRRRAARGFAWAVLFAAGVAGAIVQIRSPLHEHSMPLPQDLRLALAEVRASSPADGVVLAPIVPGVHPFTGFGGRRVVLERPLTFEPYYPSVKQRQADVDLAYNTTDPQAFREVLDRYGVARVLERRSEPLAAEVRVHLRLLHEGPEWRSYEVVGGDEDQ